MNSSITILLADDNQLVLDSVQAWLEDDGFRVETATCAGEALQLLAEKRIDLVLVDLKLPDLTGEEFIQQGIRIQPETRFVIHTGSRTYSVSNELKQLGLQEDDVVYKPILSLNQLTDMIRSKLS